MPVTTIKLSEALKRRVTRLAQEAGTSVHAFMVHAVQQSADMAERRKQFVDSALAARKEFSRTSKGFAQGDVEEWALRRANGASARRPRVRRWALIR